MKYLGCFSDEEYRDIPYKHFSSVGLMTNERCASHCIGFKYAATQVSLGINDLPLKLYRDFDEVAVQLQLKQFQSSSSCFCGNSYGNHGNDSNGCNQTCSGNDSQHCGSRYRNSVYQIGPGKIKV